MTEDRLSCTRSVVENQCPDCQCDYTIKHGCTNGGKQRYRCKQCGKTFLSDYTYNACQPTIDKHIILFTKEGLGIRSTARVLKISATTLLKRIVSIAKGIPQPPIIKGRSYEVDEMRTFIGMKSRLRWIVYALDRESKQVVSFNVGRRTNQTLRVVITSLKLSDARKIYTDKLKNYRFLITQKLHSTTLRATNHIERRNLTLRTHLKRLNRKTICFSRSLTLLVAIIKIYLWG